MAFIHFLIGSQTISSSFNFAHFCLFQIALVFQVFTGEISKQLVDKCNGNINTQATTLQVVQELCKRRPEIMVQHMPILMDKSKWQSMLKAWMNDMIATLALYDEVYV